jgi:excisionase family DNA binding protein
MIRRNRRPNWRRIKTLRSYTIDEAARALGVHRNSIRHWIKKGGLRAFTDQRPHLIQGGDLATFLQERRVASKRRCGTGQFYCVKCRRPQRSAEGMVDYEPMTASRGALVAICPACGILMRRFVSPARMAAVAGDFNVRPTHPHESLKDTSELSLDC